MSKVVDELSLATLRELVTAYGLPCIDRRKLSCLRTAVRVAGLPLDAICKKTTSSISSSRRGDGSSEASSNVSSFVALDFETANRSRDSACAISVVRVEKGRIVKTVSRLIRPPSMEFEFTYIHGITARDVKDAPTYASLHHEILDLMDGADFVAAHNASFDKSVMNALCQRWRLAAPKLIWECTVKLARKEWGLYPTKLPDVCRHLGIPLKHHNATSDATACAQIVLAAQSLVARNPIKKVQL